MTRPTQQPLMMCQDGPHPARAGGARIIPVPHSTTTRLKCQQCWPRAEPLAIISNFPSPCISCTELLSLSSLSTHPQREPEAGGTLNYPWLLS